ncbi:MAG: GxxExxY protein [Planctomycetales bacterium]
MEQQDPRTHAIIGAAMEVHRVLGHGFTEPVYQKALEVELGLRRIPFRAQIEFQVDYKGTLLDAVYRPDFICYESVVVDLKALGTLSGSEEAQVINYLKVTRHRIGLLVNFGRPSLQFRRFVFGPPDGHAEHPQITQMSE